jgi:hypothetical protein
MMDIKMRDEKVNHGGDHTTKPDLVNQVIARFIIDTCPGGVKLWLIQIPRRTVMKNVEMKVEGHFLTIKVDLTKDFGPSSSGKTIIIASTEGNVAVYGHEEAKVGLNVYRKK